MVVLPLGASIGGAVSSTLQAGPRIGVHELVTQDGDGAEGATAHLVVVGGCQVGHQGALP